MKEFIFASGNKGKIAEVTHIFQPYNIRIISLYELGEVPDIIEDGVTFEDNAKIKAQYIYKNFRKPVIADDSGLEVEQLNWEPGVFSARYAGENCTYDDNNRKLLAALEKMPEPHRARFISCAVYYDGERYFTQTGEVPGRIIKETRGIKGFGYDPVFMPDGFNITLAEMEIDAKNKISHRSKSFNKLRELLIKEGVI